MKSELNQTFAVADVSKIKSEMIPQMIPWIFRYWTLCDGNPPVINGFSSQLSFSCYIYAIACYFFLIPLFLAVSFFFLLLFFQFYVTFFPVTFFPVPFCQVTFFSCFFFSDFLLLFFLFLFFRFFFPVTFFPTIGNGMSTVWCTVNT